MLCRTQFRPYYVLYSVTDLLRKILTRKAGNNFREVVPMIKNEEGTWVAAQKTRKWAELFFSLLSLFLYRTDSCFLHKENIGTERLL